MLLLDVPLSWGQLGLCCAELMTATSSACQLNRLACLRLSQPIWTCDIRLLWRHSLEVLRDDLQHY